MHAAIALVLVGLAAGYLARRLRRFPPEASDVLNRFVIDVCVPAMILLTVPQLQLRWELATLAILPWVLAGVGYLVAQLAARTLGLDRGGAAALFLCIALGNTSFLGFPMCAALLGEASIPLAAVYDQLGSFLLLSLVAPFVIARASGGQAPSLWGMLRRVVAFPPFIALVVAVVPWPQPRWLTEVFRTFGGALIPIAMFAVGLRLRLTPPPQKAAFAVGLVVKLGLMPLLAFGLARLLGAPPDVFTVAVVESAMPAMITAGALAMAEGLAPELAASLVGWGILLAPVTVPVWAALVQ